jgi:UDP-glucose 4-epimerase
LEVTKNWLVTGGCGFIGTNLIAHLLEANPKTNVRVLDNLTVGGREDLSEVSHFHEKDISSLKKSPEGVELIVGDIKDYKTSLSCCDGVDIIVHLAASTGVAPSVENPRQDIECNVLGTFNMLEAARVKNVNRFVFASSGAPVGEVEPPINEEKVPKPVSPYGASKLAGEGYCSAYYRTYGLKSVALRFGNVYGPRSKHKSSVVAKFFRQALAGEHLDIYGDGNQTRDFLYIDDLVRAIVLASEAEVGGEVFQIATHRETTVNEIADNIKRIVEDSGGKVSIIHEQERTGDVRRNYSDISKAKRILGWEPEFDLQEGLMRTFEYFRRHL